MEKDRMREQTKAYIKAYNMVSEGGRVLAGVSGGADSVCLLQLLNSLKEELSIEIRVLHVHHGLRGRDADRDAFFTEKICEGLKLQCRIVRIDAAKEARDAGISVEEAGRDARYRLLSQEAAHWERREKGPQVKIAVAHHGDDSAETILYNLFRGTGLKGLRGIPPVRGRIIRPLLWARREEIRLYLQEKSIPFVEDGTNQESEYARNRLRNEILPLVTETLNPQAVRNILRAGGWIREADEYFEQLAETWLDESGRTEEKGMYVLPARRLADEKMFLGGYIVRSALERAGIPLRDVTARHVEAILALAGGETGKRIELPGGIRAEREYDLLKFWVQKEVSQLENFVQKNSCEYQVPFELKEGGFFCGLNFRVFPLKNQKEFPKNQCTKWFDYDKIKDTLSVRTRCPGDYIALRSGGRKPVKAFMIDEKIPRDKRGQIPLLAEGSHVLWIVGYRISEYYKITEHTKNILEVRLDGGAGSG